VLAAAQRLRRSNDFAAAVRGGRRAGRGALVVHLTEPETTLTTDGTALTEPARIAGAEQSAAPTRAGFVVSKAVGGAVVRNRVRRQLRHLVRDRLTGLPTGSTLVVRALPAAADTSYAGLGTDLDAAISAARSSRGRGRRRS
jgi:ribonuclease P protein component